MTTYYASNATERFEENDPWRTRSGHPAHSNVQCYVFDADGKLVRGFDAFPTPSDGMRNRGLDEGGLPGYLCEEIGKASRSLGLGAGASRPAKLPDVEGKGPLAGIRIYAIPTGGAVPRDCKSALVDAVVVEEAERALLSPVQDRTVEAAGLLRWFQPAFPPGLMEQKACRFERAEGSLTLRVVEEGRAILSGKVRLVMDGERQTTVEGLFEAVVRFDPATKEARSLRGVLKGTYGRWDPHQRRSREARVTIALESLPE